MITGINGFIGRALGTDLMRHKYEVVGTVRSKEKALYFPEGRIEVFSVGELNRRTNWHDALFGVDTIVHLAARVHIMNDYEKDPLALYREANVAGTENLVRQAAQSGAKRFIYLSSIKVYGEERDITYTEDDVPDPKDYYGKSKWEAEQLLQEIASETGIEVVIIRPPIVYGPGVKANFLHLLNLVEKKIPLPFENINNLRSFIALDNLSDFLVRCLEHPSAPGEIFLVSDGEDLSTPELIRRIAKHMRRSVYLFPFSQSLLRIAGSLIGKEEEINRLCGSLKIGSDKARTVLGWIPPFSVDDALSKTTSWYLKQKTKGRD